MRISPLLHPLAVLRVTIGLTQKEMGDLVGRAARTIQAVELGKLPLSEDLAMLIAQATGIDAGWLAEGDPSIPPRKGLTAQNWGMATGPYTREDYEVHRAFVESPTASLEEVRTAFRDSVPKKGESASLTLPVMKGAMLVHRKNLLEPLDHQMVEALKSLLEKTVAAKGGDLVRWKIRRTVLSIAEENGVTLNLPKFEEAAFSHVYVTHEKTAAPRRGGQKRPLKRPQKSRTVSGP